jgi:hypothetical protein
LVPVKLTSQSSPTSELAVALALALKLPMSGSSAINDESTVTLPSAEGAKQLMTTL